MIATVLAGVSLVVWKSRRGEVADNDIDETSGRLRCCPVDGGGGVLRRWVRGMGGLRGGAGGGGEVYRILWYPLLGLTTSRGLAGMNCPFCGANDDKVIDSRGSDGGRAIRRRRECLRCERRFTTYERVEAAERLVVVKRDGTRVPFNRENILRGVRAAVGKRAVAEEAKMSLVDAVEEDLHRRFDREVPTVEIGRAVMDRLRGLDEVAYIRYASEYYRFADTGELLQELQELKSVSRDVKDQGRLFLGEERGGDWVGGLLGGVGGRRPGVMVRRDVACDGGAGLAGLGLVFAAGVRVVAVVGVGCVRL